MPSFALTIFLSAFLLFQVQPLIGKRILPWFGGSPAVWTTCMLFFQVLLLAGYAYAHFLTRHVPARRQGRWHMALLLTSLVFLPIIPQLTWKPTGDGSPTWQILGLLAATIGMPYFLLSSTGPLLQESFRRRTGRTPYRLYALSNAGSLLALLSYPFVFEPELTLQAQAWTWSISYALFVVCCSWCAWRFHAGAAGNDADNQPGGANQAPYAGVERRAQAVSITVARPSRGAVLQWLALAACGSLMLLATTNQVCQEVAVVPFLWVLPLAIYLLTFIVTFEKESWYVRDRFVPYLVTMVVLSCVALGYGNQLGLLIQLAIYMGTLLVACLVCHGELVKAKPHPQYLTLFYLVVSAGGALGGIVVALAAPRWFAGLWEYPLGLLATCMLAAVARWRNPGQNSSQRAKHWSPAITAGLLLALLVTLATQAYSKGHSAIQTTRNFYGLLRVSRDTDCVGERNLMTHGQIEHGFQYLDADKRSWPTAYYGPNSGVGLALTYHPRRLNKEPDDQNLRVGVVGLGCGTLAAYGRPGDLLRFYEINPDVVQACNQFFTFCHDSAAQVEFVLGDARIQLEQERDHDQLQRFDVLVIDAFSSDAIPMHLLTAQSIALYRQHLQSDGLLCLHISNKYLDLTGVVRGLAGEIGFQPLLFNSPGNPLRGTSDASWVVLTQNREFLASPEVIAAVTPWPDHGSKPLVWTDDYGSLRQVLAK